MSVTGIEEQDQEAPITLVSDEDYVFAQVFDPNAQYTEVTARRLFDAGIDYVRDSERLDSWSDTSGNTHALVVNPVIVPSWMFRDAMFHYLKFLEKSFEEKHLNGDMNTTNYLECIKHIESVMDKSIPVDSSKDVFRAELHTIRKKCEVILNDTI
jgi:hypothetical protein